MANRDRDRAVDRLRRAASVITAQHLVAFLDGPDSYTVRFEQPARLRAFGPLHGAALRVFISLEHDRTAERMPIPQPVGVSTRSYQIALLDRNEREVLAWHWQPGPALAGPDHPHVHVSAAARFPDAAGQPAAVDLDKLHLPTGPVSLAAVVRMLVEEFGVHPRVADWRERLANHRV